MNQRMKATDARRARYGADNQRFHEREGARNRRALMDTLKATHDAGRKVGEQRLKNKGKEKGVNAGTYGGARPGLISFFSGK